MWSEYMVSIVKRAFRWDRMRLVGGGSYAPWRDLYFCFLTDSVSAGWIGVVLRAELKYMWESSKQLGGDTVSDRTGK